MFEAIRRRRFTAIVVAALVTVAVAAGAMVALAADDVVDPAPSDEPRETKRERQGAGSGTRDVLAVSNNWEGTVDLVDPESFERLKRLDVVPDRDEREAEIATNPVDLAFF